MLIQITDTINVAAAYSYLQVPEAGAVNVFLGTVRNQTCGKAVVKLAFEAYEPMALREMEKLAAAAQRRWQLQKVAMIHVTGEKLPGEAVVLIGVTSAHREASFEACRYLIDTLKQTVPIWKKEYYADNSVWVNAHP